jgi:hypothetical protein
MTQALHDYGHVTDDKCFVCGGPLPCWGCIKLRRRLRRVMDDGPSVPEEGCTLDPPVAERARLLREGKLIGLNGVQPPAWTDQDYRAHYVGDAGDAVELVECGVHLEEPRRRGYFHAHTEV